MLKQFVLNLFEFAALLAGVMINCAFVIHVCIASCVDL
jgi:hypothetical protein